LHLKIFKQLKSGKMKRTIVFAAMLLLIALSVSVFAQSRMTEQQKLEAKARYGEYKEKLSLTEDQEPKVQEINSKYFEGLAELKDSNKSKLNKFKKFRKMKSEKDKNMKQILTNEQYKIYTNFQAKMKEEFINNRRN
jgi:Spy/CpxP family protein refolding chaperone